MAKSVKRSKTSSQLTEQVCILRWVQLKYMLILLKSNQKTNFQELTLIVSSWLFYWFFLATQSTTTLPSSKLLHQATSHSSTASCCPPAALFSDWCKDNAFYLRGIIFTLQCNTLQCKDNACRKSQIIHMGMSDNKNFAQNYLREKKKTLIFNCSI